MPSDHQDKYNKHVEISKTNIILTLSRKFLEDKWHLEKKRDIKINSSL